MHRNMNRKLILLLIVFLGAIPTRGGNIVYPFSMGKGITVEYNALNLPATIERFTAPLSPPETIRYIYAADGRKLRVEHYPNIILQPQVIRDEDGNIIGFGPPPEPTPELTIDYCGPFIYEDGQLKRVLFDGGYITFDENSNNAPEYHFHVTDHLGNVRAVVNVNNAIEEVNHYYPYGTLFGESTGLANSTQPYKYTGKELDRMHGLDLHDHGARWSDTNLGRWWKMDPLAEKYTWMSPYVLCGNNPIKFIDPNGLDWYIDKDGTYQYNPKVHSQKDLGKGQSYLGREFNSLNNGKAAYYREDGSILFDNDTEAYNRLWHQANNHYSKQAYPNGKEQGGFLLTDGRVLVLPDNNNDEFTSKIDAYGYHISPEGYVCKGEEQFPILGQIHTHQSKNASARPSYGSSNADDALLSKVLNGKPLFVLGHDNEIHGMIYSNNAVYPFDTSNTISQLLNHQIDLIGLAKQLIYSFNRKK